MAPYLAMQAVENGCVAGGDVGVDDIQGVLVDGDQELVEEAATPARAAGGDEHIEAADVQAHIGTQEGLQARFPSRGRQSRDGRQRCRVTGVVHQREPIGHECPRQGLERGGVAGIAADERPRCHHLLLLLRQHLQLHLQPLDVLYDLPHHRRLVRLPEQSHTRNSNPTTVHI